MCGISGYILKEQLLGASAHKVLALLEGVRQRGPDDEGVLLADRRQCQVRSFVTARSQACGLPPLPQELPAHDVALVHARFAIIDRSLGGHQPFFSRDGSCAVVFNGEIYNYIELKQELAALGVAIRTSSDTEVLAEGWRCWGHGLWAKLNGFWAAAIYDAGARTVTLCRDRLGVAPLYYRQAQEGFFFSSLIGPLCAVAPGGDEIDRDALEGFLEAGLKDHDGTTMLRHVRSLPAATAVTFHDGAGSLDRAEFRRYWEFPQRPLSCQELSFADAARELKALLVDAVRLRLRADVPLAFELSGGLDSSSIVALAAGMSAGKLRAYTFQARGRDESPFAHAMARRFNLDLCVFNGIENDLVRGAEDFGRVMEEPYDTPANYVHHIMLKRIKADGYRVVLTGAGGDEALAGYEASFWPAAWRAWRREGALAYCQADWYEFCRRFKTRAEAGKTLGNYVRGFLRCSLKTSQGRVPSCGLQSTAASYRQGYYTRDFFSQRLFHCQVGLLPYYLRSTDHYTLSVPIEHRFPLLDYRIVEFGLKMPVSYLFRGGWTKYILRRAMGRDLPSEVLWRRNKMGFPFDLAGYLPSNLPAFVPYLEELQKAGLSVGPVAGNDLSKLWRMIASGIWLKGRRGGVVA